VVAKSIQERDPAEVRAEFPIAGVVEGWFFREQETSAGAYLVEGADLWGRTVSRRGTEPETLLRECANDARRIERESKGAP
jgi:hypothetical protein